LIGDREAILAVQHSQQALWVGLLFVLSAGFAREYDGADLLHEPWHLFIPLAASLGTSLVLFTVLNIVLTPLNEQRSGFLKRYRSFMTAYWCTGPLAWLYAIPFERFMSPGGATNANLWLLAIVAAWRVILITRVASVMFGVKWFAAFIPVMLFADTLALAALFVVPLPIFQIMGGVRLTESEHAIQGAAFTIGFLGGISWLVWFIGTSTIAYRKQPTDVTELPTAAGTSVGLKTLVAVSLLGWIFVLPSTQPEQFNRRSAEKLLRSERVKEAVAFMSDHDRGDFPPHWDPPPRPGYGEATPPLHGILNEILDQEGPEWVMQIYLDKLDSLLVSRFTEYVEADDEQLEALIALLERIPNGREFADQHLDGLYAAAHPNSRERSPELIKRMIRLNPALERVRNPIEAPKPAADIDDTQIETTND
jgi:hypothetical protein